MRSVKCNIGQYDFGRTMSIVVVWIVWFSVSLADAKPTQVCGLPAWLLASP